MIDVAAPSTAQSASKAMYDGAPSQTAITPTPITQARAQASIGREVPARRKISGPRIAAAIDPPPNAAKATATEVAEPPRSARTKTTVPTMTSAVAAATTTLIHNTPRNTLRASMIRQPAKARRPKLSAAVGACVSLMLRPLMPLRHEMTRAADAAKPSAVPTNSVEYDTTVSSAAAISGLPTDSRS